MEMILNRLVEAKKILADAIKYKGDTKIEEPDVDLVGIDAEYDMYYAYYYTYFQENYLLAFMAIDFASKRDPKYLLEKASILEYFRKEGEAIKVYKEYLDIFPLDQSVIALMNLGMLYDKIGTESYARKYLYAALVVAEKYKNHLRKLIIKNIYYIETAGSMK